MTWRTGLAFGLGLALLGVACGDDSSDSESTVTDAHSEQNGDQGSIEPEMREPSASNLGPDAGDDEPATPEDAGDSTELDPDGVLEVNLTDEGGEQCGATFCQGAEVPSVGITVPACCPEAGEDQCGLNMRIVGRLLGLKDPGCEPLDLPGSPDDACADSGEIMVAGIDDLGAFTMPGCCMPGGKCGYDATFFSGFGFGCVSPERFGDDEGPDCTYTEE